MVYIDILSFENIEDLRRCMIQRKIDLTKELKQVQDELLKADKLIQILKKIIDESFDHGIIKE